MKAKYLFMSLTMGLGSVLALLWVLGRWPVPASAAPTAEIHVCKEGPPICDYAIVQDAVDAANGGDVIKIATGIYTGVESRSCPPGYEGPPAITQMVYLTKTVTIRGGYTTTDWSTSNPAANPTTLDAQGQGRVVFIMGDPSAGPGQAISPTIEGVRITGGNAAGQRGTPWSSDAGGGVYGKHATITIRDCRVSGNTAGESAFAGGVYLEESDATLADSTISENDASWGGGLHAINSHATLDGNTFTSNSAWYGGGLDMRHSTATLRGNSFTTNTASYDGGGLYLPYGNAITLASNMVAANTAGRNCGGLRLGGGDLAPGDYLLINNVIADNEADGTGSGLHFWGSALSRSRLLHNTIARNTGGDGSGIYVTGAGSVWLTNTIVASHTVGISVTSGNTVTLGGILWYNNTAGNTSGDGTIDVSNEITAEPAFTGDGYHITPASAALDTGVDAGVSSDIDGHHRPYGSGPDMGADEVLATSIPPDAESILIYTDTRGNPAIIQVPVGAVTETSTLVYAPVGTVAARPNFGFAGRAFDLDVYRNGILLPGFTFSVPVTITLHYANADIILLDEDALALEYWNENASAWESAACGPYGRHPDENWLAVPVCHLSWFALFGEYKCAIYLPVLLRNP